MDQGLGRWVIKFIWGQHRGERGVLRGNGRQYCGRSGRGLEEQTT